MHTYTHTHVLLNGMAFTFKQPVCCVYIYPEVIHEYRQIDVGLRISRLYTDRVLVSDHQHNIFVLLLLLLSIVMGTCGLYMVVAAILSITVLVNILEVSSAINLEINGKEVLGESFKLECYTRTTNTPSYAVFYRSTISGQIGTLVGYKGFYPDQTPSCKEHYKPANYTVSCHSDGSMFTLTISANNTIEQRTYWRCLTHIDNRWLENNVIIINLNILKINGNQMAGESFTLECFTRTNDIATLGQFYRSTSRENLGTSVGYRWFYPDQTPSCKEATITTNYTVSCNSDGSMFTLTIPATNAIEHNTYWRCETKADNPSYYSVIAIFITIPITGISMISPPHTPTNTVSITTDQPITFQCQTTQGRPAANVTWYIDNAPLSGGTTTTTIVSGDIVITTGSLTLTVNRTADDKVLSCRASNYVNMEPVESTQKRVIRVKYAPSGPPIIVGYNNGTVYRTIIGRPQSVTCQIPTAHPDPTLSWSCPSYTVTGTTPLPGYTDVVSSSITWTATRTEPEQTCQCTSYQEVSGHVTTYINIVVPWPTESCPKGSITGPVLGAVLSGIVIGVLVVLGTHYLRGHWQDKGPKEDTTQRRSENQLSTGDQGAPVYTHLELSVRPHVEHDQHYKNLTPDRSASTSAYQTLDIAGKHGAGIVTRL